MKTILFISSNIHIPWGGSEVLWYKTAVYFKTKRDDVEVAVATRKWPFVPNHICDIRNVGGHVFELPVPPTTPLEYLKARLKGPIETRLKKLIQQISPDLILHSMGKSFEGGEVMNASQELCVPYINLIHLSSELQWPENGEVDVYKKGYARAYRNFFVSERNKEIVCKQLGFDIPNADIVRNPILVPAKVLSYPDTTRGYHLALPAALVPIHKGQDVLFDVLARSKWKKRPIHLNLYGDGSYSKSLHYYCHYLGLENVHFRGHVDNIEDVWTQNHALIMASRMEGLPLTLIEAMSCGRLAIAPDIAGIKECVQDGKTGFIARAVHADFIDEAMERAWKQKDHWQEMGQLAADRIREIIPFEPVKVFALKVLDVL